MVKGHFMVKTLKKISAVFLIKKEKKYLFQQRKKYSLYHGGYVLPGGHIEEGETILQGAVRELYEELDILVDEADLEFKMVEPIENYIVFFFEVKKYTGVLKNKEPEKHLDVCFLDLSDEKIHPLTLNEIIMIEQGVHFLQGKTDMEEKN